MAENTVWMLGEKSSRRFFDANDDYFNDNITFGSFYPSKRDCEAVLRAICSSSSRQRYAIVETEVLRFDGRELVVSYDESFREESVQNTDLLY